MTGRGYMNLSLQHHERYKLLIYYYLKNYRLFENPHISI